MGYLAAQNVMMYMPVDQILGIVNAIVFLFVCTLMAQCIQFLVIENQTIWHKIESR